MHLQSTNSPSTKRHDTARFKSQIFEYELQFDISNGVVGESVGNEGPGFLFTVGCNDGISDEFVDGVGERFVVGIWEGFFEEEDGSLVGKSEGILDGKYDFIVVGLMEGFDVVNEEGFSDCFSEGTLEGVDDFLFIVGCNDGISNEFVDGVGERFAVGIWERLIEGEDGSLVTLDGNDDR